MNLQKNNEAVFYQIIKHISLNIACFFTKLNIVLSPARCLYGVRGNYALKSDKKKHSYIFTPILIFLL